MNLRFFYTRFETGKYTFYGSGNYRWPKYPFPPDEEPFDGELIALKDQKGCFYLYIVRLLEDTISLVPESCPAENPDGKWRHPSGSYPRDYPIVTYNKKGFIIGLDGYEVKHGRGCTKKYIFPTHYEGMDEEVDPSLYGNEVEQGFLPSKVLMIEKESKVWIEQCKKEEELRVQRRAVDEEYEKVELVTEKNGEMKELNILDMNDRKLIPKWWGFDKKLFIVHRELIKHLNEEGGWSYAAENLLFFCERLMEAQEKDQPNSLFTFI